MMLYRKTLYRNLGVRLSHENIIQQQTPFPLRISLRSLKILLKHLRCRLFSLPLRDF